MCGTVQWSEETRYAIADIRINLCCFFFFQAEDGIRDDLVTGVQTCALPIFKLLLDDYPFTRQINEVHMHHTWIPNHDQDRGLASVEAMWRYHTQHLGWSDIAQHLTIDKHGRSEERRVRKECRSRWSPYH